MEFVYRNNPQSLFRKYQQLVTWFSNTDEGRDLLRIPFSEKIGLFLPNGYHKIIGNGKKIEGIEATFYTRPIYAPILYTALQKFDLMQPYIIGFDEAKKVFQWSLGLHKQEIAPRVIREFLFHTITINPDANVESTSVDGYVGRAGVNESWSTIRSGSGNQAVDNSTGDDGLGIRMFSHGTSGVSGNLQEIDRLATLFDTSSLTSSAVISSATASLYALTRNISIHNFSVYLVACNPASNTALVNADYNIANWTMVSQSDTVIAVNSLGMNAYNDFPLNSTDGLGKISKTGITKLGFVSQYDISNTDPSYTTNGADDRVSFELADKAAGHAPKLVINYTLPSPSASISPSASVSPSSSVSLSISPSSSKSPSASASPSASISPSASVSPSSSASASMSPSISPSASKSPSSSGSPSPSQGYIDFTRGRSATLPSNDNNLSVIYSEAEENAISREDDVIVGQKGTLEYMIHQFKVLVGEVSFCEIEFEGESTLAPSLSPVYLQIYNRYTNAWETIASDNSFPEEVTFELFAKIKNLTNYKDASNIISCRVYQLAI